MLPPMPKPQALPQAKMIVTLWYTTKVFSLWATQRAAAKVSKCDLNISLKKQSNTRYVSERAFPVFFGDIFGCSTPSKKSCFSTEEFTRFLSTVSSQRRATRSDVSFQTM